MSARTRLAGVFAALALSAAGAAAPTAQATQPELPQVALQDICVMTWHHIGEICTSQADDIARAKAQCLATSEDKTACARTGLIINPAPVETADAACIQVYLGPVFQGCLTDIVPNAYRTACTISSLLAQHSAIWAKYVHFYCRA